MSARKEDVKAKSESDLVPTSRGAAFDELVAETYAVDGSQSISKIRDAIT
jgi:hypothetical protein